jgi:hypothetical protein
MSLEAQIPEPHILMVPHQADVGMDRTNNNEGDDQTAFAPVVQEVFLLAFERAEQHSVRRHAFARSQRR